MNSQNRIWTATVPIAIGQAVGIAAISCVFSFMRCFDHTVLFGSLAGALLATVNYFVMYLLACKAADRAANQDVIGGQKLIQFSYIWRMIFLLGALVLLAKSGWCHVIALAIPLALSRPILTIYELIRKKAVQSNDHAR